MSPDDLLRRLRVSGAPPSKLPTASLSDAECFEIAERLRKIMSGQWQMQWDEDEQGSASVVIVHMDEAKPTFAISRPDRRLKLEMEITDGIFELGEYSDLDALFETIEIALAPECGKTDSAAYWALLSDRLIEAGCSSQAEHLVAQCFWAVRDSVGDLGPEIQGEHMEES